jgi:hypothetical protein
MKFYLIAIVVCAAEACVYTAIGVMVLGWKHGGGYIPLMILFAIMAATWRTITRRASSTEPSADDGSDRPAQDTEKERGKVVRI